MHLFFLTVLRPLRLAWQRRFPAPEAHAPNSTPRRDFMRSASGLPIGLFFLSAAAAQGLTGCAAEGGAELGSGETEVDSFTIGHTTGDGLTLEDALYLRAEKLGIDVFIDEDTVRDVYDCRQTYTGPRLLRWDFREGSSTDYRYYRFVVYDETGELIGNTPSLATILRTGYTVEVVESMPAADVALS